MRTALAHTRFDRRADIIARMILGNFVDRPFRFWDMYVLTMNNGLTEEMLEELRIDAEASLRAAQAADPKVTGKQGREMLDVVITSAERRLFLATSAAQWLKAVRALKAGEKPPPSMPSTPASLKLKSSSKPRGNSASSTRWQLPMTT